MTRVCCSIQLIRPSADTSCSDPDGGVGTNCHTMSRERDRFRKFPSGNKKRKKLKKMEEFNASLKGSFDKFVTKITNPTGSPAAVGPRVEARDDDEAGEGIQYFANWRVKIAHIDTRSDPKKPRGPP